MDLCPAKRIQREDEKEMSKESFTLRMTPEMLIKIKTDAEALNIKPSQLIIAILEAQLNGEKFSKLDFLIRKTFRGPTLGQ